MRVPASIGWLQTSTSASVLPQNHQPRTTHRQNPRSPKIPRRAYPKHCRRNAAFDRSAAFRQASDWEILETRDHVMERSSGIADSLFFEHTSLFESCGLESYPKKAFLCLPIWTSDHQNIEALKSSASQNSNFPEDDSN